MAWIFLKKESGSFKKKKMDEILKKIQFHEDTKKMLEKKRRTAEDDAISAKIMKEITLNEKMIRIWKNNERKLRQQMADIED